MSLIVDLAEATATVDAGVGAVGYIREYPFPTSRQPHQRQ